MLEFSTPDLVDRFFEEMQVGDAIFQHFGGHERFYGPISTVFCFEDSTHVAGSFDSPGQNRVLVVDGGASMRMALTGDEVLGRGIKNGWAGAIFNGCIRDTPLVNKMPIGVKALAAHPSKRIRRGEGVRNVAVSFAGVTFRPGDYVFADGDGFIVLSAENAKKVL